MLKEITPVVYPDNPKINPPSDDSWQLEAIDAPGAWSVPTSESTSKVGVVVIDTGIYRDHQDILGVNPIVIGDTTGTDLDGHGTKVAGIIAARHNTGHGMAGMCPDVILLISKVAYLFNLPLDPSANMLNMALNQVHGWINNLPNSHFVICLPKGLAFKDSDEAEQIANTYFLQPIESFLNAGNVVVLGPANPEELSATLPNLPPGLGFPANLTNKIRYNPKTKRLTFSGVMSEGERSDLLKLSQDPPYARAIEELFQKSQPIKAERCVPAVLKKLLPKYPNLLIVSSSCKTEPQAAGLWEGRMPALYKGQNDVDVWAPGDSQCVLDISGPAQYKYDSGNSLAISHVAGLAALLFKINPQLTESQVGDIIRSTAETQATKSGDKPVQVINAFAAALKAYNLAHEGEPIAGYRLVIPGESDAKMVVLNGNSQNPIDVVEMPSPLSLPFCRFISLKDLEIIAQLFKKDNTCIYEGTLQEILRGASPDSHKSAWEHQGCKELRTIRLQGLALGVRYTVDAEPLKNATVCLEHKATKVTFQAKTDETGRLVIPFGEPGPYKMVIEEDLPDGSKYELELDLEENKIYETDPRDAGKSYIEVIRMQKPKQDVLLTKKNFYKSGVLACEYTYFNVQGINYRPSEMLHGIFTSYHENGKKKSEGKYVKGNKDGIWHEWFDDGKLDSEGTYREGMKESVWKETTIELDRRVSVECEYRENLLEGKYVACWPDGKKFIEKIYEGERGRALRHVGYEWEPHQGRGMQRRARHWTLEELLLREREDERDA